MSLEDQVRQLAKRVAELEREREDRAAQRARSAESARGLVEILRERRRRNLASYARSKPAPKPERVH